MIVTILFHIISAAAWFCAGYYTSKTKYLSQIIEIKQRQQQDCQRTNVLDRYHDLMVSDLKIGKPVDKAVEDGRYIHLQYANNHKIHIYLGKVTDDQMRKDIVDKLNDIISGKYGED